MKTVLITGASSGIGYATALFFQEQGWQVAATMRSPEKVPELARMERVICPRLDVTDPGSIQDAITETRKRFGVPDVIVNNAGYGLVGPFETADRGQIEKQFATNFFGILEMTRQALPLFRERKQGILINVTSMGGRITFPYYSLYHATKWGVEGFSESLAHELRSHQIQVKLVEPGPIKTDFYTRSMDRGAAAGAASTAYPDAGRALVNMEGFLKIFGSSPQAVARVIYRAATDGRQKLRYPAGWAAACVLFFRKILPGGLFHRMVGWVTLP